MSGGKKKVEHQWGEKILESLNTGQQQKQTKHEEKNWNFPYSAATTYPRKTTGDKIAVLLKLPFLSLHGIAITMRITSIVFGPMARNRSVPREISLECQP
jgi:hypothetical protein